MPSRADILLATNVEAAHTKKSSPLIAIWAVLWVSDRHLSTPRSVYRDIDTCCYGDCRRLLSFRSLGGFFACIEPRPAPWPVEWTDGACSVKSGQSQRRGDSPARVPGKWR